MDKAFIVPLVAIIAIGTVCSATPKPLPSSADALLTARTYKYQLRAGRYDLAPQAVAVLDAAAKADPTNIELLNELGIAYFMQLTTIAQRGGKADDPLLVARSALDAFERALQLDPSNAEAVAGHGMAQVILASRSRDQKNLRSGFADLNRGVELAPWTRSIRLMRAFTLLASPLTPDTHVAIEQDLAFLMAVSAGTPAADVLHVLLADMYLETGRRQDARREYEGVANRATFGGEQAKARLAAMQESEHAPAAEIARLRANLGRQCTMCHAQ